MKKSLRDFQLIIWMGCVLLACGFAGLDGQHIVRNKKPVREFSIPDKIPGKSYVYFMAIGDQGQGGRSQKLVANLMNEKARKDSLHFVLTLGDNFYNHGVTSTSDSQWLEKFERMYDLPYLHVPFYATLGNHDHHFGRGHYQVEYSKKNDKWKMPHEYYTFVKRIDAQSTIQFFALDTEVLEDGGAAARAQLAWLERELRASNATWKIVFGHHPVYSYGLHGHQEHMIDLVNPLLKKYKVDALLAGHDHDRQLLGPVGDVHHIISGTGSKSRHTTYGELTVFAATNLGFAWFRVSAAEFHLQFIDGEGKIEYAHTWTKKGLQSGVESFSTK